MTEIIIEQEIVLRHVLTNVDVPGVLLYANSDPYAVKLIMPPPEGEPEPIVWDFARQLISDGLVRPAGIGDVQVAPLQSSVTIRLRNPDRTAVLLAPRRDMAQFLARTYAVVRCGGEAARYDLDGVADRLLGRDPKPHGGL